MGCAILMAKTIVIHWREKVLILEGIDLQVLDILEQRDSLPIFTGSSIQWIKCFRSMVLGAY